jgi:predicted aspartyl protease
MVETKARNVYTSIQENAIQVLFTFCTKSVKTKEKALLNSGATYNLINKRMAKRLGITLQEMKKPQRIQNADFSENKNGSITYYTNLEISKERKSEIQHFYLTNLKEDRMIFGFP